MKAELTEYEGCFGISLTAENQADAVALVRLAMNRTDELRSAGTDVRRDGIVEGYIVFGKNRRSDSTIIKRK